jgi:hypothetical protein
MRKIIVIAVIAAVGWYGNYYYRQELTEAGSYIGISKSEVSSEGSRFKCDGRTRCSQMTSCEEAVFFINNCPGTKMDGDNDGIPCERQWCG